MNFNTLSKQRKFVGIAAVVGVIAMFLPWVSVSAMGIGRSVNGLHDMGFLALLGYGGAIAAALVGKQDENMDKRMWMVALGSGAISLLITLYAILDINTASVGGFVSVSYGIGIFLSLAAAAAVVASAWMFKKPEDTLQGGFDALKSELNTTPPPAATSKVDELAKLADLKAHGKITEAEYEDMKAKL